MAYIPPRPSNSLGTKVLCTPSDRDYHPTFVTETPTTSSSTASEFQTTYFQFPSIETSSRSPAARLHAATEAVRSSIRRMVSWSRVSLMKYDSFAVPQPQLPLFSLPGKAHRQIDIPRSTKGILFLRPRWRRFLPMRIPRRKSDAAAPLLDNSQAQINTPTPNPNPNSNSKSTLTKSISQIPPRSQSAKPTQAQQERSRGRGRGRDRHASIRTHFRQRSDDFRVLMTPRGRQLERKSFLKTARSKVGNGGDCDCGCGCGLAECQSGSENENENESQCGEGTSGGSSDEEFMH